MMEDSGWAVSGTTMLLVVLGIFVIMFEGV